MLVGVRAPQTNLEIWKSTTQWNLTVSKGTHNGKGDSIQGPNGIWVRRRWLIHRAMDTSCIIFVSITAVPFLAQNKFIKSIFYIPLFRVSVARTHATLLPRGWRDRGSLGILSRNAIPDFKSEGFCRGRQVASIHVIPILGVVSITTRVPILGVWML